MKEEIENIIPKQIWFTLKEVCSLKNLGYKNSCNKKYLQPNKGIPDGKIGGRKMWNRETVLEWVLQTDSEILDDRGRNNAF
ncbi:MAG: hypothetical protein JEZ05_10705 [Tenericutes bacterium]|nr:hypothetical protein [Mycoplasmatota bacterium]